MITLKLNSYSQKEVNKLAELLNTLQPHLHQSCTSHDDCKNCDIRHLCLDIAQATMYAEEYESTR